MKKRQELLTDEQWELPEPLFPEAKRRRDGRGRPWASNRACFEGILWILQTGAAGRFLPDHFPSPSTCRRRLQRWEEKGIWLEAWRRFLGALDSEGLLRWDERFLDGSFAPAKNGALPSAKPSVARAQSGWYWSMVKAFRREFGWMDGNCGATNVAGLWNEPTPGWDSFADCWFAMSICFPPVVLSSASLACGSP